MMLPHMFYKQRGSPGHDFFLSFIMHIWAFIQSYVKKGQKWKYGFQESVRTCAILKKNISNSFEDGKLLLQGKFSIFDKYKIEWWCFDVLFLRLKMKFCAKQNSNVLV